MNDKNGILLESGTGEVEILHFVVAGEHYAINVVKVKELLQINNISKVPNAHAAIPGVSLIRDSVVPVIDMLKVLEDVAREDIEKSMNLVCEFNQLKVAFAVDKVMGIQRLGWDQIMKPDDITNNSLVIGNINLNGEILMLLDFERIVMDINPSTGISTDRMLDIENRDRSSYKVVLADDSPMIRQVLKDTLTNAGFRDLRFFDDGQQAYDYIMSVSERRKGDFKEEIDLLITDIEMPQLDGHTLTRRIKEDPILRELPVIIFSSLITEDLKHKGHSVGADGQMSKPEIENLINLVDTLIQ